MVHLYQDLRRIESQFVTLGLLLNCDMYILGCQVLDIEGLSEFILFYMKVKWNTKTELIRRK